MFTLFEKTNTFSAKKINKQLIIFEDYLASQLICRTRTNSPWSDQNVDQSKPGYEAQNKTLIWDFKIDTYLRKKFTFFRPAPWLLYKKTS